MYKGKNKTGRQSCRPQTQTTGQNWHTVSLLTLRTAAESRYVTEAETVIWVKPHLVLLVPHTLQTSSDTRGLQGQFSSEKLILMLKIQKLNQREAL